MRLSYRWLVRYVVGIVLILEMIRALDFFEIKRPKNNVRLDRLYSQSARVFH